MLDNDIIDNLCVQAKTHSNTLSLEDVIKVECVKGCSFYVDKEYRVKTVHCPHCLTKCDVRLYKDGSVKVKENTKKLKYVKCRVDVEENSECTRCCKHCKVFLERRNCKYESVCIFAKRGMECNHEMF